MTRLHTSIWSAPDAGVPLLALGNRVQRLEFGTDRRGFADLSCAVPMSLEEAFLLYDRPTLPHVSCFGDGATAWQGRLEDVSILRGGVRLQAMGYRQALFDAPYTALWSSQSVAEWVELKEGDTPTSWTPRKFEMDTNNRLFIGLRNGESYRYANDFAGLGVRIPHGSSRLLETVSFTYNVFLPTSWRVELYRANADWSNALAIWIHTANGALQTGTQNITLSGSERSSLILTIWNNTGGTYTPSGTTPFYTRLTGLRIKSTTSTSVGADEIAGALAAFANGLNAAQLRSDMALIESPGLDLRDEVYEDAAPGEILTRLAGLGDSQTPPRQWEWGVFEDRRLHFRPRGSAGRHWYVDIAEPDIERTIAALVNSAYATYQEESGRTLRTATAADADSIARYGLTRREMIAAQTTSLTQAQTQRDAFLADGATPRPRVGLRVAQLFDASGALWPTWMARSGDLVTIRNLPPTLSSDIDRIRTFRLDETRFFADSGINVLTPESPLPSLEVMLAREEAGV